MKKLITAAFALFSMAAFAQEDKEIIIEKKIDKQSPKKQTQEIIIRKKGDDNTKVTVEINGEKVLINGKPLSEFKDEDITINKRNITIFDGKNKMMFEPKDMEVFFDGPMKGSSKVESKPFLGINMDKADDEKDNLKEGVKLKEVTEGSPAEKAKLMAGDVITKIDSKKVNSPNDVMEFMSSKKPKDEITITYEREGKQNTTKAILAEQKIMSNFSYSFSGPRGEVREFNMPPMDFGGRNGGRLEILDDINPNEIKSISIFNNRPKIGLRIQDIEEGSGVKVLDTDTDSPAQKAGIKKDDIITEINGKAVENTDDARELLKPQEGKNLYNIKAKRNGAAMSFDIKIPKKLKTANL